jgi:site-specific DNA recombinase
LLDELVWSEVVRLLEDPTLIETEISRRLDAARDAAPTKRQQDALNRDLIRVQKSMERLLTAYQEALLSLEELRQRMPDLRQREQRLRAELQSLNAQSADRANYLRLTQTLSAFLGRLRESADTLDIKERQQVMRLIVKDVVVGKDTITIRHSIPTTHPSPVSGADSSSLQPLKGDPSSSESYLLRSGRDH